MKESELIRQCRLLVAKDRQVKVIKIHGSMFSEVGTPDLIGSCYGTPFAIECKVGDNSVTPIQKKRLSEWEEAGAYTAVVYTVDQFCDVMKHLGFVYTGARP